MHDRLPQPPLICAVTLLSILSNDAIAVPLSPGFPANELKYILENSEALVLVASPKFKSKANEVLSSEYDKKPVSHILEKIEVGADLSKPYDLSGKPGGHSGMMLYTSGTTSRPVYLSRIVHTTADLTGK